MTSRLETLRANLKCFEKEQAVRDQAAAIEFVDRAVKALIAASLQGKTTVLLDWPTQAVLQFATPLLEAEGLSVGEKHTCVQVGFQPVHDPPRFASTRPGQREETTL